MGETAKMRIGIFTPYLDSLGGGERYMLTIAQCLSKTYVVDIFWDDKKIKKKALERLSIDLKRVNFVENIFYSKKNLLKKLILTRKYDLIIFLSDGSIPSTLAKRNIIHFQCPFLKGKGKSFLNRLKLTRFQAIICNSRFTKRYIDREYRVNSQIVYPPVETEKFNPGKKRNLIISVGRFSKYFINKKQREMVRFFKKISPKLPRWELCLIGGLLDQDREYFKEVKTIAKRLSVKLLPNEPFKNLKKYYAQAKIYWHAAGFGEDEKKNPAGFEHFGISVVEAMAAGCVPIVFNGGGLREIVSHGEDGFLWKSEEELIDYTLRVTNDEALREKMGQEAIKKSKRFSKEKFCQRIDRLLLQLFK